MVAQSENELIKADVLEKAGIDGGMAVGDLGCGNLGFFTLMAARRVGSSGVVYAVDIMKSSLQAVENIARQSGLENIKTVWSNLELFGATRIPAASLDAAFIHNVLFQSKKKDFIIKEAARLLKDGGKLMIIDWNKAGSPPGFGPAEAIRLDVAQLKELVEKIGLTIKEQFSAGPYHFGLVIKK